MRFGDSLLHHPQVALKELKQIGTVAKYQKFLEEISNEVNRLIEDWLVAFFIVGLREHLSVNFYWLRLYPMCLLCH